MRTEDDYGRSRENPIRLNSIPASIIFLDNLVTEMGYHIVYQRLGSELSKNSSIVDHYEIMTSDNRYDDIYFTVHNTRSTWIPPKGYLFDKPCKLMSEQLLKREGLKSLDEDDIIDFEVSFVYATTLPKENQGESTGELNITLPVLERYLPDSKGVNLLVDNFPFDIIREHLTRVYGLSYEKIELLLSSIKSREK